MVNNNDGRDQNIAYSGGVINVQNGPSDSVLQKLSNFAAFSALHDSESRGPRTRVHEGTRKGFIEKLEKWIEDPVGSGRVYWVRGGAGVGKSAIAQTICEKYAGSRLAASFFFSRNDADNLRNSLDRFVPTLAYQIAESHGPQSKITSEIGNVLNTDPRVMHVDWEELFRRLVCRPCATVEAELWTNLPRLVVIDGLDECMDRDPHTKAIDRRPGKREAQRRLLSMIWNATCTQPSLPLHFLIFSRPERAISNFFGSHIFIPAVEQFDMRELHAQAHADIELYLRDEFARFLELNPDIGLEKSWPGEEAIHKLTSNADAHFIYVVTAVRYIVGDDGVLLLPRQRLAAVLRTSATSTYPDLSTLDQLYHHILDPFMDFREQILLPILQLIISPHRDANVLGILPTFSSKNPGISYRSRRAISKLLKLDPQEVSAILSRLHSILYVPDDEDSEDVKVLHASFPDFLTEEQRSHHFHIEPLGDRVYFGMVSYCLLPILNDMVDRYRVGERIPSNTSNFELYSLDVWLFMATVFDVFNPTPPRQLPLDEYIPSEELLLAMNEFDVYQYMNMLLDRDYMGHIYMALPRLIEERVSRQREHRFGFGYPMDVCSTLLFENVSCVRELYSRFSLCAELTSGPYSSYSRFCSELSPFINMQRPLFDVGWLLALPKNCASNNLEKLALLIAIVCKPLPSCPPYHDRCLEFLDLPRDTDDIELHAPFKIFPHGTDLAAVSKGSDVWYIDYEKSRIFIDTIRKLGGNLGLIYPKWGSRDLTSANKRAMSSSIVRRQFTGLDDWNSRVSELLDLHPLEDASESDSDSDSDPGDWSFGNVLVPPEPFKPDAELDNSENVLDHGQESPSKAHTPLCEGCDSDSLQVAEKFQSSNNGECFPSHIPPTPGPSMAKEDQKEGNAKQKTLQPGDEKLVKESEREHDRSTCSLEDGVSPQPGPSRLPDTQENPDYQKMKSRERRIQWYGWMKQREQFGFGVS